MPRLAYLLIHLLCSAYLLLCIQAKYLDPAQLNSVATLLRLLHFVGLPTSKCKDRWLCHRSFLLALSAYLYSQVRLSRSLCRDRNTLIRGRHVILGDRHILLLDIRKLPLNHFQRITRILNNNSSCLIDNINNYRRSSITILNKCHRRMPDVRTHTKSAAGRSVLLQ